MNFQTVSYHDSVGERARCNVPGDCGHDGEVVFGNDLLGSYSLSKAESEHFNLADFHNLDGFEVTEHVSDRDNGIRVVKDIANFFGLLD